MNPNKNSQGHIGVSVSGVSISLASFGFKKRGLLEKGSFQKSLLCPDYRESRDSRLSREPQTVENQGESDHFLEVLENLEILEALDSSSEETP